MTCSDTVHTAWCTMKTSGHSDAAKRVADTYNLHRIGAGLAAVGKWIAVRLQDGTSDDVLYDYKIQAVRHQKHNERYFAFLKIAPCDMKTCEAEVMLATHRQMYKNGMRMTDPDHKQGGPDLITRLTVEDQLNMMRGVVTNLKMPGRH